MKGDLIKNLPTDDTTPLSDDEEYMYTNVFLNDLNQTQNKNPKFMIFIQSFLICMGLFILLNVPQVETVLRSVSSIMSNNWVFIICKSFLFALVFFTIENFHLGKGNKGGNGDKKDVKKLKKDK